MAIAWYVLHTYSGHENRVKTTLEQRVRAMQMEDKLSQILVPTQEVAEIKSGKRKISQKTSFPGYVLVKMDLDNELWYIVKSTPGVMGFVGTSTEPTPLNDEEVEDILKSTEREPGEEVKQIIDLSVGDKSPTTDITHVVTSLEENTPSSQLNIVLLKQEKTKVINEWQKVRRPGKRIRWHIKKDMESSRFGTPRLIRFA